MIFSLKHLKGELSQDTNCHKIMDETYLFQEFRNSNTIKIKVPVAHCVSRLLAPSFWNTLYVLGACMITRLDNHRFLNSFFLEELLHSVFGQKTEIVRHNSFQFQSITSPFLSGFMNLVKLICLHWLCRLSAASIG